MLKKFITQFLIYTFIIIALAAFPVIYFFDSSQQQMIFLNFLIFLILVFSSTTVLINILKKGTDNFYKYFLAALGIKMLLAIVYFYFIFDHYEDNLFLFVGSFFISYLLFTIFSLIFLLSCVNKIHKNDQED